ncbi:MAG: hypothetical protein GF332_03915 [Candidatus Moranbacteria bacterium]|nr:hypothetical protein [Candidatus Moranbacteria bacterium]
MKLNKLLKNHNIQLSKWSHKAYKEGLAQMKKSKDPTHDAWHVQELVSFLNDFLNEETNNTKQKINFNILIPSIAWHDVWKSRRKQRFNPIAWFYHRYYEGHGSKKIFLNYANINKLPKKESNKIAFAIVKHAYPIEGKKKYKQKANPKKHIEACLLYDLDYLDVWNINKYLYLSKRYLNQDLTFKYPIMRFVVKNHYKLYSKDKPQYFLLPWTQKKFETKRKEVLNWAKEVLKANNI